jgi:hypothetical protein
MPRANSSALASASPARSRCVSQPPHVFVLGLKPISTSALLTLIFPPKTYHTRVVVASRSLAAVTWMAGFGGICIFAYCAVSRQNYCR